MGKKRSGRNGGGIPFYRDGIKYFTLVDFPMKSDAEKQFVDRVAPGGATSGLAPRDSSWFGLLWRRGELLYIKPSWIEEHQLEQTLGAATR